MADEALNESDGKPAVKVVKKKKKIIKKQIPAPALPSGWEMSDMEFLFAAREDGMPYISIAKSLGRKKKDCRRIYTKTDWTKYPFYDRNSARMKNFKKRELLDKLVDAWEDKLEAEKMKTEVMIDRMFQYVQPYPEIKEVYEPVSGSGSSEDAMLILSDCHIGHSHTLSETNGLGEYSPETFARYCSNLKKTTSEIVDLHRNLYPINTLHIACIGDIVTGMNDAGEWSSTFINMPVDHQVSKGFEEIASMIEWWLGQFEKIVFYGVRGNHGRAAPKGQEKDHTNWDIILYRFLQERFRNNPRVTFICPESWFVYHEIRNQKFLMLHGDELSGGTGALGKLENATKNIAAMFGEFPKYTIGGHYHCGGETQTSFGKVILNGSFVGGDMYSMQQLQKSAVPIQKFFGIHDKIGITWSYDINLTIDK